MIKLSMAKVEGFKLSFDAPALKQQGTAGERSKSELQEPCCTANKQAPRDQKRKGRIR